MKTFAEGEMAHLEQEHIDYVSNWIRWITAEWKCERERTETHNSDLWLKPIDERVKEGTCISNLHPIGEEMSNSQRVLISFSRNNSSVCPFKPGDVCLLSNKKHVSIAFTVIDQVSDDVVRVSCDKTLRNRYDAPFHLDKYTISSTIPTTLGNLVCFLQNDEIGARLRNVLVGLVPPKIVELGVVDIPSSVKKIIVRAKLNNEQRLALIHALFTQDYVIIEGLPGSGKTTLISVLIQCLIATNKKVLLAAFTHSAVDNILGKLKKEVSTDKILRLGSSSTIKEEIKTMTLKAKLENESSEDYYNAVKRVMKTTPIVACTCHHVPRELLFSYRQFDVVIIDEASMVLEPLILPVLATSSKFVLVGDCKQLTPLVVSKKAKLEGAGVSTMEKLQNAHPKSIVSLTSQYRMNKELAMLSSKMFYQNRLICGNEAVARSSLDRTGDYTVTGDVEEHLSKALSGEISNSCVFLDTQSVSRQEMRCEDAEDGGIINNGEAKVVVELCQRFIENGIKPHEIGVITVYRRQVENIRKMLKNEALEVNTVDSYQGREKRIIIWSLAWTDNSSKKSELLRDERRVNVALTRARQKLVVVGCKKSAESIPVLFRFSQMITNHSSIPV
uniref:DNA replication ATP-dependent helicase/nuclease DNA2 n=1 Tax=Caenorhabditis japonica TaxID=281687 RepID=A0A8R1DLD3_CAEJA